MLAMRIVTTSQQRRQISETFSLVRLLRQQKLQFSSHAKQRVVVTGLGIVCPLGVGSKTAWKNLLEGKSAGARIEDERFAKIPSKVACFLPQGEGGFNADAHFTKSEQERMSASMLYGLVAAREALEDANWTPDTQREKERTGVSVGMGMVDLDYIGKCYQELESGRGKRISPYFVPRILPNLSAGHISIAHGLMGPNLSCSTACATGSHAIADAFRLIEGGEVDVMVAGGVDACINPLSFMGFSRARALSTKYNTSPERASRPFDRDRDGFVMGEGAGIILLESEQHARERGAEIYCEMLGYGMSGDADHITAAREDGEGALLAMKRAFESLPEGSLNNLWQVNTHATSTPRGDIAEMAALHRLTSGGGWSPYITANKGGIGHLLGAAGGVESAFTALSIKENKIPPVINLDNLDPAIPENLQISTEIGGFSPPERETPKTGMPRKLSLKNSFGFGGTNVSLLFAEHAAC